MTSNFPKRTSQDGKGGGGGVYDHIIDSLFSHSNVQSFQE